MSPARRIRRPLSIYGDATGGSYVCYRRIGSIVERFWNFSQNTSQVWVAGSLAVGYRCGFSLLEPAVLYYSSGIVSNNTAEIDVTAQSSVNSVCAAAVSDGHNIGHCVWIAAQ